MHRREYSSIELVLVHGLLTHGLDDIDHASDHQDQKWNQQGDDDAEIATLISAQAIDAL
jgi:hypothetical protein